MEADQQTKSMWIADVLDAIGVNERILLERRKYSYLQEAFQRVMTALVLVPLTVYSVGSQIEGTTTVGMESDFDFLQFFYMYNIIQDLKNWERNKLNFLMIQDETVTPGYCYLQAFDEEAQAADPKQISDYIHKDSKGRLLLLNSTPFLFQLPGFVRHGPASSNLFLDRVRAYPCQSWPPQARQWLDKQIEERWPSEELKRSCGQTDCSVVPVGCKGSKNERFEWRISTTLAERCLMLSLNITQIRCNVLMKMILKTYIKPKFGDIISSYMCKTILLHRISNTDLNSWNDRNLLSCLEACLYELYRCIQNENCPHFIISDNNLMSGRFSKEIKQSLLEKVLWLSRNVYTALREIEYDNFRWWLFIRSERCVQFNSTKLFNDRLTKHFIFKKCIDQVSQTLNRLLYITEGDQYSQVFFSLFKANIHSDGQVYANYKLEKTVYTLCSQQFSSVMGSTLASSGIQQDNKIPSLALEWMECGLDTDVSSSRLKLASMFYFNGDMKTTKMILKDIQDRCKRNKIDSLCQCSKDEDKNEKDEVNGKYFHEEKSIANLAKEIQHKTALCVRFSPSESNYVPQELKYEMFRSTHEDLAFRREDDYWMDWAVVDSITYLYFLQYKIYSCLGKQEEKQKALNNLEKTIDTEINLGHRDTPLDLSFQYLKLGRTLAENRLLNLIETAINPEDRESARNLFFQCLEQGRPLDDLEYNHLIKKTVDLGHRETALNLLGQCLEQEKRPFDALTCYLLSLKIRERNNAANIHICRLLSTLINNKRCTETIYERVKK